MSARVLALLVLLSLAAPPAMPAATTRLDQGDVVARIVVEQGNVFLQTRSGKPIVVPGHLSLRPGDVLTTPEKVVGHFELVSGGTVPLAPLHRYRVGERGIEEPVGAAWQLMSHAREVRALEPAGDGSTGLIAKVRLVAGQAFHRPRGWPTEVGARGSLSLAAGDELRLVDGGLAQVQMVDGGWLYLAGPALAAFDRDSITVESGSALAKALGAASVTLGPYRIHGGARVFSFATGPNALTVAALTGVLTVEVEGGRPTYLAPGRRATLIVGRAAAVSPIAIRPEVQAWEEMFHHPGGPRPAHLAAKKEEPAARKEPPPDLKKRNPLGEGPERRSGPPDPRVEEPHPVAVLPLRDRIHAMESFESRKFYIKKRQEKEATVEYKTYQDQVAKSAGDEVEAFRLFKLHRTQLAARQELDDYRHGRELTFEERLYTESDQKDQRERDERERLFGQPLFLDSRRLLTFAEANRQNLINGANAVTRDIEIANATGASAATISNLQVERQNLLTLADQQTDGMKELLRLALEPYR